VRFDPYALGSPYYDDVLALSGHLTAGPLEPALRELVEVRSSQITGCAFCLLFHSGRARTAGATQAQLDTLAGWRESALFSGRERAALGLTEAMTRLHDGSRVDAETWDAVRRSFDDSEVAALLYLIALINVWNRINVAVELPADHALPPPRRP